MIRTPLTHRAIFWDALIVLLCVALILLITLSAWLLPRPFSGIGIGLGAIGIFTILYGSFIEPKLIKLNTKNIQNDLPEMHIAVIGDLHVGPYKQSSFVQKVVQEVNKLEPDLIVIVGDFIFDHTSDISHLDPLRGLRARYGVFGSIGNHDSGEHLLHGKHFVTRDRSDEITSYLQERGITMLRNASRTITIDKRTMHVAGIDDIWMPSSDLDAALKNIPENDPIILLAHNPDVILDARTRRASLVVSGHTHGGQVRLPFIGAVHPIPNKLGRAFDQGIFNISHRTTLIVTHGIGETQARARLFCTPEILLLAIHS